MLHKRIRALIADDSSIARDVVKSGLELHKDKRYIEVTIVKNGVEALSAFNKQPIDIAFVDIHMPGLDGPSVVTALRDSPSENCLIVAMSANLDQNSEAVLRKYNAYHFLKKPFRFEQVANVVMTYIVMTNIYRILIVDDSATMRKMARRVLEGSLFNFDVVEAGSAEEAITAIKTGKYCLVLTDFQMPDVDGLELAGKINALSSKIAIYMMSTTQTTYLERSAAFIGVSGFLKKPFTPRDIDTLMHKYLGLDEPSFGKVREMFSYLKKEKGSN